MKVIIQHNNYDIFYVSDNTVIKCLPVNVITNIQKDYLTRQYELMVEILSLKYIEFIVPVIEGTLGVHNINGYEYFGYCMDYYEFKENPLFFTTQEGINLVNYTLRFLDEYDSSYTNKTVENTYNNLNTASEYVDKNFIDELYIMLKEVEDSVPIRSTFFHGSLDSTHIWKLEDSRLCLISFNPDSICKNASYDAAELAIRLLNDKAVPKFAHSQYTNSARLIMVCKYIELVTKKTEWLTTEIYENFKRVCYF